MTTLVGYCTNVHAGADLAQTQANLERHALAVKALVSPDRPLGIGLWLSASSAESLDAGGLIPEWASWLKDVGLLPFTFNGFPYGDFHQPVVKHRVYEPTWADPRRLDYTRRLVKILDAFLAPGQEGTISTLPVAWGSPCPDDLHAAARALRALAGDLARLRQETGRTVSICLEPEPGCVIQRGEDVVHFFEDYLLPGSDEHAVRSHVRVCHDVCHHVVMFEEQAGVLARYRSRGIRVGKVQVSSAVVLPLARILPADRPAAFDQLRGFREERYLHQTVVRRHPGGPVAFYEDLPQALAAESDGAASEWRTHFHVPVFLRNFGHLEASQSAILDCAREVLAHRDTGHFEVETYAWGVLPLHLREPDLARGIAREMTWFANVASALDPGPAVDQRPP